MEFDELKKSWKSQPIDAGSQTATKSGDLISRFGKQQRGVLRSNIIVTLAFCATFILFGKLYLKFHEGRTVFFGGSMLAMAIVMLIFLWVQWKGYSLKKMDLTQASSQYLDRYLRTLTWRKALITTYSWVYSFALWLSLMFYMADVLQGGSRLLYIEVMGGTTLYIFGVQLWTRYRSRRKQLTELNDLIEEMELLKIKVSE